jgi:hypothetical protein
VGDIIQINMENQPTKLDKTVKISIIVGALVVALSVAYYLIIFLPQKTSPKQISKDKKEFLFQKQTECMQICQVLYEDDKKSLPEPKNSVFNPRYVYNENKNACFYSGGWLGTNPDFLKNRIVNCQTNEEVLTFMTLDDKVATKYCDTCVSSLEEYSRLEKEYMENGN